MQPITDTRTLAETCARLARHPFVTVDTEFLRESTYYPKLCVLQMASVDEAVVVDALAPGIELAPLFELMADPSAWSRCSTPPARTSRSAGTRPRSSRRRCSTPRSPRWCWATANSISYDQLVQRITGDTLDKSSRFTDWTRRPLTEAQLTTRSSDVTHLRDVYMKLSADLEKRGRAEWLRRRDARADLARHLPDGARARLGAAQDARAQAARSWRC